MRSAGGIGFAASANLNPARTGPSIFEPVHGAAHDIAGSNEANPLAAIWSAALMVKELGHPEAASRIAGAVQRVASEAMASSEGTDTIGQAVVRHLEP